MAQRRFIARTEQMEEASTPKPAKDCPDVPLNVRNAQDVPLNVRQTQPDATARSEELSLFADPALLADGWVRRHLVDPSRAQESIDLYTAMGFEVKAQKLTPENLGSQCKDCAAIVCASYIMIYTRKKPSADAAPSQ